MKRILAVIVMSLWAYGIHGQGKDNISIELGPSYHYYSLGSDRTNNFNYGLSVFASAYIRNLKVSTGIQYSTKSFNTLDYPTYEYNVAYLTVPILGNYKLFASQKHSISLLMGLHISKLVKYDIKKYHENGVPTVENVSIRGMSPNLSVLIGCTYSRRIGNSFAVNLSPYINFKLRDYNGGGRPSYKNLPEDKLALGLQLSVEYLLKRNAE